MFVEFRLVLMMRKAIQIDKFDNVATSTSNLDINEIVEVLSPEGVVINTPTSLNAIAYGHKIALINFDIGDKIIKYGEVIGVASKPIKIGEWIHTHNIESVAVPTSTYKEANT